METTYEYKERRIREVEREIEEIKDEIHSICLVRGKENCKEDLEQLEGDLEDTEKRLEIIENMSAKELMRERY